MTIQEAMQSRHTVRRYTGRKIPEDICRRLRDRIEKNNEAFDLAMSLAVEDTGAFGPLLRLVLAKGVRNYVILAGRNRPGLEEDVGYCGADVMLLAQTLGLNSWWVGGTFSRGGVSRRAAPEAEKILGLIAVGCGAVPGGFHEFSKTLPI